MRIHCLCLITCFATLTVASGEDWSQFRGPNGDGKSPAVGLPIEFGETQHVRWKTPIHDKGWSSPVVAGDQIWLTTASEDGSEVFAVCVDVESGEIVHDIKVFDVSNPQLDYPDLNTHATPTPVVQGGRVYVHFGTYGTSCLDRISGTKIWERRDLNCDHCIPPASSPIIDGDSLFVAFDGLDRRFVVALDTGTGDTLWLQEREIEFPSGIAKLDEKAFSTAKLIEHQGRRQLISPSVAAAISYDPDTGRELWRIRHGAWNAACLPLYENELVYFVCGSGDKRLVAVRPSGNGDVTDTHIAWESRQCASDIASPVIVDDLLFATDKGVATCLDANTGTQIWKHRLGGDYWASPLYADGRIYFSSKQGKVSVIAASRDFRLLTENEFDEGFVASPAVANDAIILRSSSDLYCIGL